MSIMMSRDDIIGLSLHSLDDDGCSSFHELDDDDIDLSDNENDDGFYTSSLTYNDDGESYYDDQEAGSFRWTDITKFADASPAIVDSRGRPASTEAEEDEAENDLDISRRNNFRLKVANRSNIAMGQRGRVMDRTPRPQPRRPTPPPPEQRNSTDLGNRISHLLLSPNSSPRTVMAGIRRGRVVGRKKFRESTDTRTRKTTRTTTTTSIADEVIPDEEELEMVYYS